MIIQNVKGGYDYLPKEQKIKNYINNVLKETFEEYGYKPIETPILCYYDILSDKYDKNSDILKEIYKLSDQAGRNLGLRYDLTVPFAKFIALNKNNITLPFKRYEINKVFRDGPVKIGRDREFTQCDVDVVGLDGNLIEAELLTLYVSAFNKLNIDIIIKYNSRNLMSGLILESGIKDNLLSEITTIIDKKDKLSNTEFEDLILNCGITKEEKDKLIMYFNMSLDELKKYFNNTSNEKIKIGLEEIKMLDYYINKLNINDKCMFSSFLARGQNYYTGNVFEVYDKNKRITSSIGAGGRYDNMITNFIDDGQKYPAVGISFGLSSIYEILKDSNLFEDDIDIYIIPLNSDIESLLLANKLRNLGYKVEIEMKKRNLRKSLDFANKQNINYVIILGEDEIKNEIFNLKNMKNNKSYEININEINKVKDILN